MKKYTVNWVREIEVEGNWFLRSGSTEVEAKDAVEAEWKLRNNGYSVTGSKEI